MDFLIRKAIKTDMPEVLRHINALAHFEKEPEAVKVTTQELEDAGFGNTPLFHCFVAELQEKIVGIALTYLRFSTWKGKTLHLEDLIVEDTYRGSGLGTKLLNEVVLYGKSLNVRRISWEVLDWNENAIKFYESKGARILKNWHLVQMNTEDIDAYTKKLDENI